MRLIKSLRILMRLDFPSDTVRLWQGSGPYLDRKGKIWRCCVISESALDQIESAINAEAFTLELGLSGIDETISSIAWREYEEGQVIGAKAQIIIQPCDENDQPVGDEEVVFTGTIDNLRFNEAVSGDEIVSDIIAEITNRFTLRTVTSGAVLSDVDQRARAAVLNPTANPDRFCERVVGLSERTINWPAWN
jgi:hypothetical protein